MFERLKKRWHDEGGYREVLIMSVPLILSTGSITIQHFVDRMFLSWYSKEAIAAAMPAGILNYAAMSLFIGTATYVNTFVAQYYGAKRHNRIGPAVWQGLYFSLLAALAILPLYPLAPHLFALAGHAPAVQVLETEYFQILIFSGFAVTASSALAGFFSGRGDTKTVMWVTFASTFTNIVLDYAFIFGNWGFEEMGMKGAALATVISQYVRLGIYLLLIFKEKYQNPYWTVKGWKPEKELFTRLIRFGLPNGLHFFLEMTGYSILILIMGRYGTIALAATNITFNINHLAFMPMIGMGMALTILVGKRLGQNDPTLAEKTTWTTVHLASIYIGVIALAYAFTPNIFIYPYAAKSDPLEFSEISKLTVHFLKFVALYSIFDAMNFIFADAIKGAGDTRFVMRTSVILSWTIMVIPSYLVAQVFHLNIYIVWACATAYICMLGIVFLLRFRTGKWKTMRVIEHAIPIDVHAPKIHDAEVECQLSQYKKSFGPEGKNT